MAAGGGDLGPPPRDRPTTGGVEQRVGERAHGDRRCRVERPPAPAAARRRARRGRRGRRARPACRCGSRRRAARRSSRRTNCADRLPGDPPHDLALEVALGDGVVARRRARLPPRLLGGEQRGGLLAVVEVSYGDRLLPARQPGRVAHHVADLDVALAVGGELGPVRGHRGVEVELALVGEHRGRPAPTTVLVVDQTLMIVSRSHGTSRAGVAVGRAAPQVDDQLAVDRHGDRRALVEDPVVALGTKLASKASRTR